MNDGSGSGEFWSDLKSAFNVAQPIAGDILDARNSALGPVSSPIAALVGAALRVARKLARQENDYTEQMSDDAHVYRAMLAEAALCVVEDTDEETVRHMKIVETMQSVHSSIATQGKLLVPKLLPVLTEPVLRIALDAFNKQQNGAENEFFFNGQPQQLKFSNDSFNLLDDFTRELLAPTVRETGDESFWVSLGDILSIAGQVIDSDMQATDAFENLAPENQDASNLVPGKNIVMDFTNRAIMGEAVLQALQRLDPKYLESEGFLAGLKSVVQKMGPTVLKVAPSIIEAMGQIVRVQDSE